MFSQLFGKYLVDNKVITKEQLDEVISKMENVRAKLGFIAVSKSNKSSFPVHSCLQAACLHPTLPFQPFVSSYDLLFLSQKISHPHFSM